MRSTSASSSRSTDSVGDAGGAVENIKSGGYRTAFACDAGFTLLELAITLAIVAVLAGAVLVPFVTQIAQRNKVVTEKNLDQIREALLGFAVANGRFPCPAPEGSANGDEAFAAGGSINDGNCASFNGFLPATTLGFTPVDNSGFAIDGWATAQNRIRYAVSNQTINVTINGVVTAVTNPFTRVNGMRTATASQMSVSNLLYVCNSGTGVVAGTSCGTAVRLTDNAPVVIWSVGANAATGGTSVDEQENRNPNGGSADRIFVSRTAQNAGGGEFDDIVTWLSIGNVVSRLVLAGQLP